MSEMNEGSIIMSEIKLVEGGIFTDYRGRISHVNGLDMSEVERFYVIHHNDVDIVRAWHGHRYEKKWFYVVKGAFTGAFVKVDDWENPSRDLVPEVFQLSAERSQVLCVPEGYANGFKAEVPDSSLLVFSSKRYPECLGDSWRYPQEYWMRW